MTERVKALYYKMIDFDRGRPDLIQHFTKVHAYAQLIGETEGLDAHTQELLEAAALAHDIAIPLCDEKYGSHPGQLQEKEGPPLARALLAGLPFEEGETERICALIGEHHTYAPMDGIDHQILVEADFLVNSFSHSHSREECAHILQNVFATAAGKRVYAAMFGLE